MNITQVATYRILDLQTPFLIDYNALLEVFVVQTLVCVLSGSLAKHLSCRERTE